MKKLKRYESFLNGTHLGNDQVNTDSAHTRNISLLPDTYSDDEDEDFKEVIIDIINRKNLTKIQLQKLKYYLETL